MLASSTSSERPTELLTAAEAAAFLRRSPYTLADWRRAGTGPPAVKDPRGRWRYDRRELEEWVRSTKAA